MIGLCLQVHIVSHEGGFRGLGQKTVTRLELTSMAKIRCTKPGFKGYCITWKPLKNHTVKITPLCCGKVYVKQVACKSKL